MGMSLLVLLVSFASLVSLALAHRLTPNKRAVTWTHKFVLPRSVQASAAGGALALSFPLLPCHANSAAEALQLLDGYQTLTPVWVTWTVLIVGVAVLQFEFFKWLASW